MRTSIRLVAFAVVVVGVFGLGWGIGAAVGPFDPTSVDDPPQVTATTTTTHPGGHPSNAARGSEGARGAIHAGPDHGTADAVGTAAAAAPSPEHPAEQP